ncbi:potassium transporter TrkA [Halosimplex salinum]|uniref:potassium transporter TrkA n=1 Tax=Halosimplex salinum TaxID=1710538 RepID=UPI000F4A5EEE|nr:potassium transporter TrkA [Halosimplex salinum]
MIGVPVGPPSGRAVEALVVVAQSRSLTERLLVVAARILGLSLIAAGVAAAVALLYRWYVRERVPGGLPALFGLSAIVPLFGANKLLTDVITDTGGPVEEAAVVTNIAVFLVALAATRLGTDVGDHLGTDLTVATGERAVESEVSRVVQAVGRVITVELPDEIDDIVGYDPVPDETKEKLAGKTFVFPRRLTVDELRGRLITRLKADYAVGHVDVELGDDGSVEFLAVGSRAAGIGPTLPPETSAVAVRADPAFAASAGDLVQVWRKDPFERVLTAEVRGTVDDVVTLAIDAADTRKLDAETDYRLVTLPVETRPDREFASVLRAAEETMAAVTVGAGSSLAGQPIGAIDVTVVAIRPEDGPVEPLPARDRLLAAGDALYVVAAPEAIRKVEQGATPRVGATPDAPSPGSGAALSPDEQVDASTAVAGEPTDDTGTAAEETESPESGPTDRSNSKSGSVPDSTDSAGDAATDLAEADAPGIQALEPDESEDEVPAEESPAEEPEAEGAAAEPTREDLDDLPGADVDELTGTDATVDDWEDSDGPDERGGEAAEGANAGDVGEADPNDESAVDEAEADVDATDEDDESATDEDDESATDEDADAGSGWTVAVDERRDREE